MTIMANVAARQKKADFTNLERDFKKKFQSLRKNTNHCFEFSHLGVVHKSRHGVKGFETTVLRC